MAEKLYESVVHCGPDIVAVKVGQRRVHADNMCSSAAFEPYRCIRCEVEYLFGNHVAFPPSHGPEYYYAELQAILDQEHRFGRNEHLDSYSIDNG
jgi:hypothetical protein